MAESSRILAAYKAPSMDEKLERIERPAKVMPTPKSESDVDAEDLATIVAENSNDDKESEIVAVTDTEVISRNVSVKYSSGLVLDHVEISEESFETKLCVSNNVSDLCLLPVCENASVYLPSFSLAHETFNVNWCSIQLFYMAAVCPNPPWEPPDDVVICAAAEAYSETIWNKQVSHRVWLQSEVVKWEYANCGVIFPFLLLPAKPPDECLSLQEYNALFDPKGPDTFVKLARSVYKADAKGSKEEIYSSRVKCVVKKDKPYKWITKMKRSNKLLRDELGNEVKSTGFGESTELSDAIEDSKELMCSFVSHENNLLLDSRVDYSALSCVSFVAASLSLSGPIYMAIESEELISPEDTCIQRLVQRNQPEVAACDAIPEVAACGLDDPCGVEVKPIGSETSSQHLGIKYSSESNNLIKLELIVAASCEEVEKSVLVVDDQVSLLLSSDPFLIEDAPKPKHPYLILELQKEVISEYFTINYSSDLSNNEVVMEVDETPELGISFSFSNLNLNSCSPSVCKNASEDWPSYLTMLTDFHSYNLLPKLKVRCVKPPAKPPDNIDNLHVDDLSALVMILNDTCEEESSLLSFPDPWKHMRGVHKFLQVKVVDGNFVYDKGKGHNYKKKNDLKIYKHSVQDIGKLKPTVFDVFPHMLYILFGFKEVILKLAWLGKPPPLPPEICHNRSAHIGTDIIDNFGLFFPSTRADGLSIFFIFAFFASYWITFPSKIYEKNLQQHIYFESLGSERQTEYGKDAISLKFISAASYNAMVAVVVVNEGSHDSSTISQLTQWYVTQIPSCHSSSRLQQDNNALGAYLVTLMYGFHFVVYCARMLENARCISLENHVMQFDSNDQQSLLGTTEMSILLSIEMRQGSHAPSYVVKIEPLAEACDPVTFTKLDIVAGLTYLKTKKHELVASTILQPGIEWGNTYSELTAPQDVAIYGKLRALASFDSTELKNKVINNSNFKSFLEFVTGVRELKNNLHSSHYPSSLGNFGDNKSDLFLDINEHAVVYHGHTKSASILLNKSYENRGHDFGLSQLASSSCAKHLITLAPDATSHLICQLTKLHVATGDDASAQQFVYYGLRILDAHIYAYRWTANMEKFQEQFLKFSSPRPPEVADLEDKVDFKERGMLRVKEILVMWGNIKGQGGARCRGLILAEMQLRGASYNRRRTAGKEDKKGTTRRRGMASLAQE